MVPVDLHYVGYAVVSKIKQLKHNCAPYKRQYALTMFLRKWVSGSQNKWDQALCVASNSTVPCCQSSTISTNFWVDWKKSFNDKVSAELSILLSKWSKYDDAMITPESERMKLMSNKTIINHRFCKSKSENIENTHYIVFRYYISASFTPEVLGLVPP